MTLAIAMTTAKRAVSTLERAYQSLRAAGFDEEVLVAAEPGTVIPDAVAHDSRARVLMNEKRLGCFSNWKHACRTLLKTSAQWILIVQDDAIWQRGSAHILRQQMKERSGVRTGFISPYLSVQNLKKSFIDGWNVTDAGWGLFGALAFCMERDAAEDLLKAGRFVKHPGPKQVDAIVGLTMLDLRRPCFVHLPSLVDHIGETSTVGHEGRTRGRVGHRFREEADTSVKIAPPAPTIKAPEVETPRFKSLTEIRAFYDQQLRVRMGAAYRDKEITLPAAQWLHDYAMGSEIKQIVELGSGFSTLVFAMIMARRTDLRLITTHHDQDWMRFVVGLVDAQVLPRIEAKPLDPLLASLSKLSRCDLIFVDHGSPTYAGRLKVVPEIVQTSRRLKAAVIFDDWFMPGHPEWRVFSKDLVNALRAEGARCETIPGTARKDGVGPKAKHLGRLVY